MLKTIVIDDEKAAREYISGLLKKYCPAEIDIVAEADSVKSGMMKIQLHHPDLVFLDISLSDGTGFDLLRKISPFQFRVIFITAYSEYAIQAIRFSALDYLVKPVNIEDLINAVRKAKETIHTDDMKYKLEALLANFENPPQKNKKLVIKSTERINVADIDDIIRCESNDNYTLIFLKEGKKLVASKVLKEYEELLAPCGFFRCHHSHLINPAFIESFEKKNDTLRMKDGSVVPVSTRKKEDMILLIENL